MTKNLQKAVMRRRGGSLPDEAAPIPIEKFVTYGLLRLTNRLNRQSMRLLDETAGLGLPEWRCMAMIGVSPRISLNEIADRTGMDRGLISRAVRSLADKGLLLAERDRTDRRLVRAAFTARGRQIHRLVSPVMLARQLRLQKYLGEADLSALHRILNRLNLCLDEWPSEEAAP